MTDSFYWHDYETWGVNPAIDRPAQFAGLRTDTDLNIVGKPLNILCRPALDTLPQIGAALVTGIDPFDAEKRGLSERDFFKAVHTELARPGTCGVGYNSIRFDDEVTRYGFYRNFIDPYAREWQGGNSRWDIIDMVRLCHAVRPEGINWPVDDEGRVSFRLEKLTEANNIAHEGAHDALSDVYATIEFAKLIKARQPKLYEHALGFRSKVKVQNALELGSYRPKLHISSRFGSAFACGSIVVPVAVSPANKNEIICIDLRYSPEPLIELPAERLRELQFTRVEDLPDGIERIPLKSVHLNRSPIVLSPGLVDERVAEKIQIDRAQVEKHRQQVIAATDLPAKLVAMYEAGSQSPFADQRRDVDAALYAGFIPRNDRQLADRVTAMSGDDLAACTVAFEDERLNELFFRYRARNFESTLNAAERQQWYEHCADKLLASASTNAAGGAIQAELDEIASQRALLPERSDLFDTLAEFLRQLKARLEPYTGSQ